jgi:hypothetical protein
LAKIWSPWMRATIKLDTVFGVVGTCRRTCFRLVDANVSQHRNLKKPRSLFTKYFCGQCLYFSFSIHKQCTLSHFIHNSTAMFP